MVRTMRPFQLLACASEGKGHIKDDDFRLVANKSSSETELRLVFHYYWFHRQLDALTINNVTTGLTSFCSKMMVWRLGQETNHPRGPRIDLSSFLSVPRPFVCHSGTVGLAGSLYRRRADHYPPSTSSPLHVLLDQTSDVFLSRKLTRTQSWKQK